MKKLTINEIAEMVGVSKTTISFYLNGKTNKMSDETQKKIQQVIEETGYTPSAATRTVKASDDCIGVDSWRCVQTICGKGTERN